MGQDAILQRVVNPPSLRRLAIGAQVTNLPHNQTEPLPSIGASLTACNTDRRIRSLSDYTILHLDIAVGVQAYVDASADLSHTASFIITPPPGFTVDYSTFGVNTAATPEPRAYWFTLPGFLSIVTLARRKNRRAAI